jgi:hypothetical protein
LSTSPGTKPERGLSLSGETITSLMLASHSIDKLLVILRYYFHMIRARCPPKRSPGNANGAKTMRINFAMSSCCHTQSECEGKYFRVFLQKLSMHSRNDDLYCSRFIAASLANA